MSCGIFRHDWTKEVFIAFGDGSIFVRCCRKCHDLKKSRTSIVGLHDIDPRRLSLARKEALEYDAEQSKAKLKVL